MGRQLEIIIHELHIVWSYINKSEIDKKNLRRFIIVRVKETDVGDGS